MFGKTIMTAAFSLAVLSAPAIAQTSSQDNTASSKGSGSDVHQDTMGTGAMGTSTTGTGAMGSDAMASDSTSSPKMTRSQMATMKRCQAMTPDKMMKSKTCTKLQKMHPEMSPSTM